MKAYLETVVITHKQGGDSRPAVSQVVLDFINQEQFLIFKDQLDTHESGVNFSVYRTLIPIYA